ncbi:phytanoyl-CoA dioxygenase [Aureococcus anophagefferens]|nr:phytanoyl-CoA dioxygenase [Aureococcus anophagefferens]
MGRRAPACDWDAYADRYPDVRAAFGRDACELAHGAGEGRHCAAHEDFAEVVDLEGLDLRGDADHASVAGHFCGDAQLGGDCEASVRAAVEAAASANAAHLIATQPGTFEVPRTTVWGQETTDGARVVAASWLRERDFASRCAPDETSGTKVAVLVTGQLRVFGDAHRAKLRRDLADVSTFVATYPEFRAEAEALGAEAVYADAAALSAQRTELDLGKARYWFERAAAKGDEDAITCLAALDARA